MKKQYKFPYFFIAGKEYFCLTSETSLIHITSVLAKNSFAIANYQSREKIRKILKHTKTEISAADFKEYLLQCFFNFWQKIPGTNEQLMLTTLKKGEKKNGKTI